MRELVIAKYKDVLHYENMHYRDWKDHLIQEIPDFDSMSDADLLYHFMQIYRGACQPR